MASTLGATRSLVALASVDKGPSVSARFTALTR